MRLCVLGALCAAVAAGAGARNASRISSCDASGGAPPGVTIVTQASVGRLKNLRLICDRWRGRISLAIHVQKGGDAKRIRSDAASSAKRCSHAAIETVMEHPSRKDYPVNLLRNVAFRAVRTSHAWILDVDFIPSQYTRGAIDAALAAGGGDRAALVVPAFVLDYRHISEEQAKSGRWENQRRAIKDVKESDVPNSLSELQKCLGRPNAYRFVGGKVVVDSLPDVYCHPFHHHGSTRFVRWLAESKLAGKRGDAPNRLDCFIGEKFEPYVVVRACGDAEDPPAFDERYTGYGKNKLEWIYNLRAANYTFATVKRAFVTHAPHANSKARDQWNNDRGRATARQRKDARFSFLVKKGRPVATPICDGRRAYERYEHPSKAWRAVAQAAKVCALPDPGRCVEERISEAHTWANVQRAHLERLRAASPDEGAANATDAHPADGLLEDYRRHYARRGRFSRKPPS